MKIKAEIAEQLNRLGSQHLPFVFLISYSGLNVKIFSINDSSEILWQIPGNKNHDLTGKFQKPVKWKINPVSFEKYEAGFKSVQHHIFNGDTYLLNYTQPTPVDTNLTLEEIYHISVAPYKIYMKDRFVCFSPECFVKIENGKISSFPMKGTIDAGIDNAKEKILNDSKEIAEHNTIVDLIRNDLSRVAENVTVEKFRYLERIKTNHSDLWQVSSKISGILPENYPEKIGDILFAMLPAGSVTGAPKKKTMEIIQETEIF